VKSITTTLVLLAASTLLSAQQPTVTKDLAAYASACVGHTKSTVCTESFDRAIGDARKDLAAHPDDIYLIRIPAGTFDFSAETPGDSSGRGHRASTAAITVSDISPAGKGRLILQGAGKDKTMLITNDSLEGVRGEHVSHLTIAGLTFNRPGMTTTQGNVVDASKPGQVTLDIQPGFPTPGSIYRAEPGGKYIRVYTNSRTNPQLVLTLTNEQIAWGGTKPPEQVPGSPSRWTLYFSRPSQSPSADYTRGALVCVKSKQSNQAYLFNDAPAGGSDIVFDDIRWLQQSRGAFRGGIVGIKVLNSEAPRAPAIQGQTPCLASPAGGPQIGQPKDPPTHDNLVENFFAEGTGDDSIAFFNDDGKPGTPTASIVRNAHIANSFAREILLANSPGVTVEKATIIGCGPLLMCPVTRTEASGADHRHREKHSPENSSPPQ
jgi:hypothetical protein